MVVSGCVGGQGPAPSRIKQKDKVNQFLGVRRIELRYLCTLPYYMRNEANHSRYNATLGTAKHIWGALAFF